MHAKLCVMHIMCTCKLHDQSLSKLQPWHEHSTPFCHKQTTRKNTKVLSRTFESWYTEFISILLGRRTLDGGTRCNQLLAYVHWRAYITSVFSNIQYSVFCAIIYKYHHSTIDYCYGGLQSMIVQSYITSLLSSVLLRVRSTSNNANGNKRVIFFSGIQSVLSNSSPP